MNDLCLMFVERALAGWEIETLVRGSEDGSLKRETVIPLLVHPGYEVLTCLLANSPLQSTILSYIIGGIEGFERELPSEELYFLLTIIRVLRIIHRVLEIQDVFLDVLIPIFSEFDSAPFVGSVRSRSFYTRFDQALTYTTKYILAIAAYVVYLAYPGSSSSLSRLFLSSLRRRPSRVSSRSSNAVPIPSAFSVASGSCWTSSP